MTFQTHPSQTCFMSSVDLHTHYSYQVSYLFSCLGVCTNTSPALLCGMSLFLVHWVVLFELAYMLLTMCEVFENFNALVHWFFLL